MTAAELQELCEEFGYLRVGPLSDIERWLRHQLAAADGSDPNVCASCGDLLVANDEAVDGTLAAMELELNELKVELERYTQRIKTLEERERQAVALLRGVADAETKQEADRAYDRLRRTQRRSPRASD